MGVFQTYTPWGVGRLAQPSPPLLELYFGDCSRANANARPVHLELSGTEKSELLEHPLL